MNRETSADVAFAIYNGLASIQEIEKLAKLVSKLNEYHEAIRAMNSAVQVLAADATAQFSHPALLSQDVVDRLSQLEALLPQLTLVQAKGAEDVLAIVAEIRAASRMS